MNRQLESSVRSTKVSDLDNCSRLYGQRQSADTMLTISICYPVIFIFLYPYKETPKLLFEPGGFSLECEGCEKLKRGH